jgi:hypothetical protein
MADRAEQIASHPHPFYIPIAAFGSDYTLEPVAYGLKFAGSFSDGILLKSEFLIKLQTAGVNATAYAAKLPSGQSSVIVLNKDAVTDFEVELDFGRGVSGAVETEILHAPALDSRERTSQPQRKPTRSSRANARSLFPTQQDYA